MEIVKLTTVLELFFAFNNYEGRDSVELEQSDYNDKYFRWTKDSFSHRQKYTVIYNNLFIFIFDTKLIRERLLANLTKIKSDDLKVNFGCNLDIVRDIVDIIEASEITEVDIASIDKFNREVAEDRIKKLEDSKL